MPRKGCFLTKFEMNRCTKNTHQFRSSPLFQLKPAHRGFVVTVVYMVRNMSFAFAKTAPFLTVWLRFWSEKGDLIQSIMTRSKFE